MAFGCWRREQTGLCQRGPGLTQEQWLTLSGWLGSSDGVAIVRKCVNRNRGISAAGKGRAGRWWGSDSWSFKHYGFNHSPLKKEQKRAFPRNSRNFSASFLSYYNDVFFFLIGFYWSIFVLQCCVSFWCTAKWISLIIPDLLGIYIYISPPFWTSFPFSSPQCSK